MAEEGRRDLNSHGGRGGSGSKLIRCVGGIMAIDTVGMAVFVGITVNMAVKDGDVDYVDVVIDTV